VAEAHPDGTGRQFVNGDIVPTAASPSRRPLLIVNPRSGGGTAVRHDLLGHCRARGIDVVVFESGDDLSTVATAAVSNGADVIGMAGGDGSQATVAAVAAEHDLPFVCVPAGTRNHFAFDVGVDRNDVVGALDAFFDAEERRVDLARANGRVFVNNVALGVYGAVVESPEYRDHKMRTVIRMLPELIGPDAERFDLRFAGPDRRQHPSAALLLVANNPYRTQPRPGDGTRGALDAGVLGVIAITGPPPHRMLEWTATTLHVDSAGSVAVGIDGESVRMEPPMVFETLPLALRVRTTVRRHRPWSRSTSANVTPPTAPPTPRPQSRGTCRP
jgi:diacylglycerol kinase family enzyme